jgi:hypothetical protein
LNSIELILFVLMVGFVFLLLLRIKSLGIEKKHIKDNNDRANLVINEKNKSIEDLTNKSNYYKEKYESAIKAANESKLSFMT